MIAIIDYQMGNLRSVQKAVERVGGAATVTDNPDQIARAEKLILPGVGAFRDAIAELRRRDLVQPITDAITAGTPFLGICLGLQLLFDVSYEGGEFEGLGIVPGKVQRFPEGPLKVPHMGWSATRFSEACPLAAGLPTHPFLYYVHSYYVVPEDSSVIAAEADYGSPFCSMIWRDNLFATQFHPEKSQTVGLHFLRRFVEY